MMKKFLSVFAIATMALATSCSNEELNSVLQSGEATVSFTTQLPKGLQTKTRAYGDGTTATKLSYAVYLDNDGTWEYKADLSKDKDNAVDMVDLTATVELQLVNGKEYHIVFWADAEGSPYTFNQSEATLTADYENATSNNESLDAFFEVESFTVEGAINKNVTLTRPFAQLNIGTADLEEANKTETITKTGITVSTVYTKLNFDEDGAHVVTTEGDESVKTNYTFGKGDLPEGETFPVDGYTYLTMNYLLMPEDQETATVTINYDYAQDRTFNNIPLQRNYRTNIYGSLLTSSSQFIVEIDKEFEDQTVNLIEGEIPGEIILDENTETIIRNAVSASGIKISGIGNLTLENVTITVTEEDIDAIALESGADVTMIIEKEVRLTGGSAGGNGLMIPKDATITISGTGSLIATGNNGEAADDHNTPGGSGIGNAQGTVGNITIEDLGTLEARGFGKHAFGIGGNIQTDLTIRNTTVNYACGGFIQPLFELDQNWGSTEPEGGAAIGTGHGASENAKVILDRVTINEADGGSKSAAIGGQYWAHVNLEISNSTLTNIQGGNASAGIGGSRLYRYNKKALSINISNSVIDVTGGYYGAGIGSGYNTYTNVVVDNYIPECNIVITGKNTINAKGGQNAAGIGTGYHAGWLTGYIEDSADITCESGGTNDTDITVAQAIGYGAVCSTRVLPLIEVTFTVNGSVISAPAV